MQLSAFLVPTVVVTVLASSLSATACSQQPDGSNQPGTRAAAAAPLPAPPPLTEEDRKLYLDAARTAWAFVQNHYQPTTGLTKAHETYANITLWDIAGVIGAHYAARRLGLIDSVQYDQRIRRILTTLSTIDLVDNTAFNSTYNALTGKMVTRAGKQTLQGDGWSVTDIGRLLIWLRILAVNEPQYAEQAAAIVGRLNMQRLVQGGQPMGLSDSPSNKKRQLAPETEIGYHQYAASGFALWGANVRRALNPRANTRIVNVFGQRLMVDDRGNDRITAEPYIMMGLETGWYAPEHRQQATRILAVQEARHKRTGTVTMVTEDAMPDPPHYFYYYSIHHNGKTFVVEGPGENALVQKPRWVSAKAAFAWNALLPSPYTNLVVKTVMPAAAPGKGWGAGVYEGTLKPIAVRSLNTAALILESALYRIEGKPILNAKIL